MKNRLQLVFILLFLTELGFSQISIGTIEKEKKEENVVPVPEYDPFTDFVNYTAFYTGISPTERCKESEFYTRYHNLEVYYPTYTSDYKKDESLIFKKDDTIKILNWSDLAEKYFTIVSIEPKFENSVLFNDVKKIKPNLNSTISFGMLFKLEDKATKEIIYTVEFYQPVFILTAFYTNLSKAIPKATFVAIKDFNGTVVPLSNTRFLVDKGSEWKGEFTLLRKSDMNRTEPGSPEAQDILCMVVLSRNSDKIITYYDSKDYYESLWTLFDTKESVEADKQATENKAKQRLTKLTEQYGESYAKDILEGRLRIGMTKEMCQESWGITLNRRSYTNASNKIDVWEYVGLGKLYFTDGKLSDIVRY